MRVLITIFLFFTVLWTNNSLLSQNRENIFIYEKEKVLEESNKLKLDWINPINLSISKSYDKNFESSKVQISINQPIFKSGGIYDAIKYASSLQNKNLLIIEKEKKNLIKEATTLLFNIYKLKSQIKKQNIIIINNTILYSQIKEQIDVKMLPLNKKYEKEIEIDRAKIVLIDLKSTLRDLISKFKILSDKPYQNITLPKLKLISKEKYQKQNIELNIGKEDVLAKYNFYKMTIAHYLPAINIYSNYTQILENSNPMQRDDNQYSYGINISIPLDIKMFNTTQSKKVDYLKAKLNLIEKEKQEAFFFEDIKNRLIEIFQKMDFTKKSIKKYSQIINDLEEEQKLGIKIIDNISIYRNYKKQLEIDLKIYHFDQQMELLKLYAKLQCSNK